MKQKVKIKQVDGYYCAIRVYEKGERPDSAVPGYEVSEEVIGHTNPAFSLPGISEQFIKEYVRGGPGCEVEIEMEGKYHPWTDDPNKRAIMVPLIDSSGNIVLSVVKKEFRAPTTINEDLAWTQLAEKSFAKEWDQEWVDKMDKIMQDPIYDAAMAFFDQVYPGAVGKINSGVVVSIFEAGMKYQKEPAATEEQIQKQIEEAATDYADKVCKVDINDEKYKARTDFKEGIEWARKNLKL